MRRVWRAQHFSSWMTQLLHADARASAFERLVQTAQLAQVASSRAAATLLAEGYVGLGPAGETDR